ncbi:hypothetical protein AWB81_01449 [Caballeronia arationis]|jgi:hypothetical protein|uniref:DUF4088 domain-containing protein n=1 Tax=Caballeronia arationis TaxID=1777142 RepID=A0A7Z7IAH4_9BURK|nr:DUF4088 family protein [Caballeronia arationis]SAK55949.1 hypothetical protein AWB81_01449 [Caballeronia arationis]SOE81001.1 Protein of unknown function [Caballeronia arationis]
MRQITLSFRDETIASLHRDFESFVRLSLKIDPQFVTPTFEDFLRAKLLDNPTPLTEQAVQHMLQNGQYAWAKRALDKEFPDVVEILIRQAAEHGFSFAIRSDWTAEDLIKASRAWATAIVTEAKGDASQVDALASQIKSAAMDIREVEEKMQTPAWRLADSLRQRVYETKIAVEHSVGSSSREKLGELRCLLRLGIFFGSIQKQEAQQVLEYLRSMRPELFIEEPYDGFTRFANWLRSVFAPAAKVPRASRAQR